MLVFYTNVAPNFRHLAAKWVQGLHGATFGLGKPSAWSSPTERPTSLSVTLWPAPSFQRRDLKWFHWRPRGES